MKKKMYKVNYDDDTTKKVTVVKAVSFKEARNVVRKRYGYSIKNITVSMV